MQSHIHALVSTWQAKHSTQRPSALEIEASKIAEFTLSLDGPATRWYSHLDAGEVNTFHDVCTKFLKLIHREVPKRKLLRQFFSMSQELHETVAQFTTRFQHVRVQKWKDRAYLEG